MLKSSSPSCTSAPTQVCGPPGIVLHRVLQGGLLAARREVIAVIDSIFDFREEDGEEGGGRGGGGEKEEEGSCRHSRAVADWGAQDLQRWSVCLWNDSWALQGEPEHVDCANRASSSPLDCAFCRSRPLERAGFSDQAGLSVSPFDVPMSPPSAGSPPPSAGRKSFLDWK